MGQEIAVRTEGNTALTSVTPYSLTSLEKLIPDWIMRGLFDDGMFELPVAIPADGPQQIRAAVAQYQASLTTLADRGSLDQILGELRLRTAIRNESVDEQRARYRILRSDCAEHCLEAVREACKTYAQENKFFPVGFGELKPYIVRYENYRSRRIVQLNRAAEAADKAQRQHKAMRDNPVSDEQWAELWDKIGGKPDGFADKPERPIPTVADYLELGLSQADAEALVKRQEERK